MPGWRNSSKEGMDNNPLLKQLNIEKLFGIFDFFIKMPEDSSPMILTGPNGYGKTTILSIINAVSKGDLVYFYFLPFRKITLHYAGDSKFIIEKDALQSSDTTGNGNEDNASDFDIRISDSPINSDKNNASPYVTKFTIVSQYGNDTLQLDRTEILSAARKVSRRGDTGFLPDWGEQRGFDDLMGLAQTHSHLLMNEIRMENENDKFFLLLQTLPPAHLIGSQRIFSEHRNGEKTRGQDTLIEKINVVSQGIKHLLEKVTEEYIIYSQSSDSNIIAKAIADKEEISPDDYKAKCDNIRKRIEFLKRLGLVGDILIPEYSASNQNILHYFVEETERKLDVFRDIEEKIRIFLDHAAAKQFANKDIEINRLKGLRVRTQDGVFLDPNKLSTGEKNELVMLYELIFRIADHSILLIDEPEISLHVAWQMSYMDEITEISRQKDLQVIVATHSPDIIGGKLDSCVDLYELA